MKLNQSVRKAAAILRCAGEAVDGETASALARAAGLPWATAVRLIRTLEEEGFLYRLPDSSRYVLGQDLVRLGRSGDHGRLLAALALPALERLVQEVQESAFLTVVHPDGRLEITQQVDIPRFIRTTDYGGSPFPLHASSPGKLLLATYDDARLQEFLLDELPAYTPATITDPAALREEILEVRAAGWSAAVDELEAGLAGVSAGVRDGTDVLRAVVSVSGPSFRFDAGARAAALEPLLAAVEAIERLVFVEGAGGAVSPQPSGFAK